MIIYVLFAYVINRQHCDGNVKTLGHTTKTECENDSASSYFLPVVDLF